MAEAEKDESEGARPGQWPGMWVRDESFWRSVFGEALGALIAALVIYVFAVVAGYVGRPEVWPVVLATGVGLLSAGAGLWLGQQGADRRFRRFDERLARLVGEDDHKFWQARHRLDEKDRRRARRRAVVFMILVGVIGIVGAVSQLHT